MFELWQKTHSTAAAAAAAVHKKILISCIVSLQKKEGIFSWQLIVLKNKKWYLIIFILEVTLYICAEMADIHFTYGTTNNNATRRRYRETLTKSKFIFDSLTEFNLHSWDKNAPSMNFLLVASFYNRCVYTCSSKSSCGIIGERLWMN